MMRKKTRNLFELKIFQAKKNNPNFHAGRIFAVFFCICRLSSLQLSSSSSWTKSFFHFSFVFFASNQFLLPLRMDREYLKWKWRFPHNWNQMGFFSLEDMYVKKTWEERWWGSDKKSFFTSSSFLLFLFWNIKNMIRIRNVEVLGEQSQHTRSGIIPCRRALIVMVGIIPE